MITEYQNMYLYAPIFDLMLETILFVTVKSNYCQMEQYVMDQFWNSVSGGRRNAVAYFSRKVLKYFRVDLISKPLIF